jgi:hypothetical protein
VNNQIDVIIKELLEGKSEILDSLRSDIATFAKVKNLFRLELDYKLLQFKTENIKLDCEESGLGILEEDII